MQHYAPRQRRPSAAAQRTRHNDATPATAQLRLGRSLNDGPTVRSQLKLSSALHRSPAMAVQRRLAATLSHGAITQRAEHADDGELLQARFATTQRLGEHELEGDELLQAQFVPEHEEVTPDKDELLQAKPAGPRQAPVQMKPQPAPGAAGNRTGLPDHLKAGVEGLSGLSMDDVRVHYNSPEPRQLQALAFAQGSDIHVAPGQEQHLPHEAWHVVQQRQGRVQPTIQAQGVPINDDDELEAEADRMGARAVQMMREADVGPATIPLRQPAVQRRVYQRVAAAGVMQLIYLWDRSTAADKPHWIEEETPPPGYLPSGRYDDGEHGDDNVFARLGESDLFYGLNYDEGEGEELYSSFIERLSVFAETKGLNIEKQAGFDAAVRLYDTEEGNPLVSVGTMNAIYGGSSGWARYTAFVPKIGESKAGAQADIGEWLMQHNPQLPWADPKKEPTGYACQVAMVRALSLGGSVRFLMDGMADVGNILVKAGEWSDNVTSHELRFALGLLGHDVVVDDDRIVKPVDGQNVFFYLGRNLVTADAVREMD